MQPSLVSILKQLLCFTNNKVTILEQGECDFQTESFNDVIY